MFGFFSKSKKEDNENTALIKRLNSRHVRYVTKRDKVNYTEEIIGREGYININGNELIICCDNKFVFRYDINRIKAGELLSLEGVTLTPDNENYTIIAYYKYHR